MKTLTEAKVHLRVDFADTDLEIQGFIDAAVDHLRSIGVDMTATPINARMMQGHCLRKSLATRLANAGATPDEIRAAMAHKTNEEGKTYTKQADRARLADSRLDKFLDAQPQRNLTNL